MNEHRRRSEDSRRVVQVRYTYLKLMQPETTLLLEREWFPPVVMM